MNTALVHPRAISAPLRVVTWLVIVSQLWIPYSGHMHLFGAQEEEVVPGKPVSAMPAPVLTPSKVKVNRTVPAGTPPSSELKFSAEPTDQEIRQARVFHQPIVSQRGTIASGENKALARALEKLAHRERPEDTKAIEEFLSKYPNSPRRAGLLANMAHDYRRSGRLTKTFDSLKEAWQLLKHENEPETKMLADDTVANLARFYVSIGRTEELRALLDDVKGRSFSGSATELIESAREALWQMENDQEQAFKCGPFSLFRIRAHLGMPDAAHPLILEEPSTSQGTTLAQMRDLSERLGMNYQMAKRKPGSEVIAPAIIYWKLGHFSAIVKAEKDRYLVEDTTFVDQIWLTKQVIDEESGGYFLVPPGPLPAGWEPVSEEAGRQVWGRMTPTDLDPNGPSDCDPESGGDDPCKGMATYTISRMQVSLKIRDIPLAYNPPVGPSIQFRLVYNHRERNQPSVFNFSNVGAKWTHDWIVYVSDNTAFPNADVKIFSAGGGVEVHSGFDPSTQEYAVHPKSQKRLVKTSSTSYTRYDTDGSSEIFNVVSGTGTRRLFISKSIDPFGNALTFSYDSNFRLVAVTDAIGQVTTIQHGSDNPLNANFYKITGVTDPFDRSVQIEYASGKLVKITDTIGISSSFVYAPNSDFITSMTTPYGTTTFQNYTGSSSISPHRWIEVTDPLGQRERVEYRHSTPGIPTKAPASEVPSTSLIGVVNSGLERRNTFYWDKKAMLEAPGDYTKAHITHWLYSQNSMYVIAAIPASEKAPLESRVWYRYPGQASAQYAGTNSQPSKIARVLDDGSTQLYSFEYNPLGKPTKSIDPVGRTTLFNYSTNHIDLLEVRQVVGATNELLATYSYNHANQPLTVTDASGQTTSFGYFTNGLVAAVTNALGETLAFSYDSNSYLTNIAGPVSGAKTSFTHDGYGRVRTVTDSEDYTVTTDYDTFDRPTKVTYPDNSYEQIVYKWLDPVLSRDRLGRWSLTTYDAARRPVAVQDAQGRIISFDWCRCGSLNGFTDPMGRTTSWTRDLQGRIINKTYPDNSFLNYIYENKTSRLKEITDPLGQRTIYSYFKDGNIQQITYSNAVIATPSVSFTYSTNYNRLLTMTDGIGTTVYDYHSVTVPPATGAGRLASVDGPFANDTITYAYDELGRTKHQAINGVGMQWSFDALGRITGSTNALGVFTNSYVGVTPRLDSVSYPNGQTTTFDYFSNLGDQRLKTIWNRTGVDETLSKFDYTYDTDGRISTWAQQLGTFSTNVHSYGYDRVNQLLSATVKDAGTLAVVKQFVYGYDKAGNRTSEQIDAAANIGRYNEANQLTNVIGGAKVRFSGQISEPGTVTVAGSPANMSRGTNFSGTAELGLGTNVVSVVATDINVTNFFLIIFLAELASEKAGKFDQCRHKNRSHHTVGARYDLVERGLGVVFG